MVGQEILVLFIMVRIRAPQPNLTKCLSRQFVIIMTVSPAVRKFVLRFLSPEPDFRTA